jgi:hypothetical protein
LDEPRHRRRPGVEPLEDRTLPTATRLLIDFTPDTGAAMKRDFRRRDFVDAFQITDASGQSPHFLDFNGDGVVDTTTDPALARDLIVERVRNYFAPFLGLNVSVQGIDFGANTDEGTRQLFQGIGSRRLQVFVMYVGGSEGDPRFSDTSGLSFQANLGHNWEGFGHAYADQIVWMFLHDDPQASPFEFAAFVASTVAHEMGHMLGLGHSVPDFHNGANVMDSGANGLGDRFLRRPYRARVMINDRTVIMRVNAYAELTRSFLGEPNENTFVFVPGTPPQDKGRPAPRRRDPEPPPAHRPVPDDNAARDQVFAQWHRADYTDMV